MSLRAAQAFFDFMKEREQVRLRKEAGLPFPWTEDSILREFKFTNVHRHHDRTSRELRERFYGPNFHDDRRSILMNCALFRYFGTWEFAAAAGWQDYDSFDFDFIEDLATQRLSEKKRVFTGAYVITNQGISAPKQEVVVHYFLKGLYSAATSILETTAKTKSWQAVADRMRQIQGFGGTGFMTKEVLLDTTYTGFWDNIQETDDGTFSYPRDWKSWTPVGPGARRGVARVLGLDVSSKISETRAHQVILELCEDQEFYGWEGNVLVPTDIQFQLCEFDKYERVRLGQGRPRSKYRNSVQTAI